MSIVTKDIANRVSRQIVEPIGKKIEEIEKEMEEYVREIAIKNIPEEILKFYTKHPKYMDSCTRIYCEGVGINDYKVVDIDAIPTNEGWSKTINLNKIDAGKVVKWDNKIDDLSDKKTTTKNEIYHPLLNLRTYKKVQEALPEVYSYLPNINAGKQLMIIPSVVREKIACLISTDVEKKCIQDIK